MRTALYKTPWFASPNIQSQLANAVWGGGGGGGVAIGPSCFVPETHNEILVEILFPGATADHRLIDEDGHSGSPDEAKCLKPKRMLEATSTALHCF